jgi:amino acid transporter
MWEYLTIVALVVLFLRLRRGRNQERAASGMATSPLYLSACGLSLLLIGVTLYMATLGHDVPWGWWIVVGAMVIAILAMRRALKWRYPYR